MCFYEQHCTNTNDISGRHCCFFWLLAFAFHICHNRKLSQHTHVWVCGMASLPRYEHRLQIQRQCRWQKQKQKQCRKRWIQNVRKIPAHCIASTTFCDGCVLPGMNAGYINARSTMVTLICARSNQIILFEQLQTPRRNVCCLAWFLRSGRWWIQNTEYLTTSRRNFIIGEQKNGIIFQNSAKRTIQYTSLWPLRVI